MNATLQTANAIQSARAISVLALAFLVAPSHGDDALKVVQTYKVPKEQHTSNSYKVNQVTFSPDGSKMAAAYGGFIGLLQKPRPGMAAIWDVKTGQLVASPSRHTDGVAAAAISKNCNIHYTAGFDGSIRESEIVTGLLLSEQTLFQYAVTCMDYCPKSGLIAVGTMGKDESEVIIYAVGPLRRLHSVHKHSGWVTSVAFSRDGHELAAGFSDGAVRVWEPKTRKLLYSTSVKYDAGLVRFNVELVPGQEILCISGGKIDNDGPSSESLVVNRTKDEVAKRFRDRGMVADLSVSVSGKMFAYAPRSGPVVIVSLEDFAKRTLSGDEIGAPLAFSPAVEHHLAVTSNKIEVRMIDVSE